MRRLFLALCALLPGLACNAPAPGPEAIVHSAYIELRDGRDSAALVASCRRRLAHIPGIVALHAGPRQVSQRRAANDARFHVALTIVFEDEAALEAYLVHPDHVAVVEDFTPLIRSLRVFDASLAEPRAGATPR